jgi:hypothetical protein
MIEQEEGETPPSHPPSTSRDGDGGEISGLEEPPSCPEPHEVISNTGSAAQNVLVQAEPAPRGRPRGDFESGVLVCREEALNGFCPSL